MKTINFPQSNRVLKSPAGMEHNCGDLHTFTNGVYCISCWKPDPVEREALIRGMPVWLFVVSGETQPPVAVQVANPFGVAHVVEERFLVWSNEHGAWWGPNRSGYFTNIRDAGRYSKAEADDICTHARSHESGKLAPEVAVSESEAQKLTGHEDGTAEIMKLRQRLAELEAKVAEGTK